MTEQELANTLISNGVFSPEEFNGNNLRDILISRGIIGTDEPINGESLEQCLLRRGLF